MGRKILAVIVALIASFAVISIVEMLNSMVVTPPAQEVMLDTEKMRQFMTTLPTTAFVVVLVGYILGAFAGGFVVTKISHQVTSGTGLPLLIGGLLTLGGLYLFFVSLPGQPIWFVAASLLCFIPMALLGHRLAR
jgi:hypothetical protein